MDGTGRYTFREFFNGRTGQNLAVFNGWFYWSDDRRLWQAPEKQLGQKSFVLKVELTTVMVYHELQQPQGKFILLLDIGLFYLNLRHCCVNVFVHHRSFSMPKVRLSALHALSS